MKELTEGWLEDVEKDALRHGQAGICAPDTLALVIEVRRLRWEIKKLEKQIKASANE